MALKSINSKTKWGKVVAIKLIDGERYYFMIDKYKTVSMIPADVVEEINHDK